MTHRVTDVFTPTKQAKLTFVERLTNDLNNDFVDALRTPGTQIVVYGHSGTGKSTLVFNIIHRIYENNVVSRCTSEITYEQLILNAFDALNVYYDSSQTTKTGKGLNGSISAEYGFLKAAIGASYQTEKSTITQRVIPPQLTAQRLAEFMGAANCCWIIEDFHKVKENEKVKLSQQLKVFVDTSEKYDSVKAILIGAVTTAREVIEYDNEMNNRVAELYVPLMLDEELHEILEKGEQLLNVSFSQKSKNEIVKFSSGLGSITHKIALLMCQSQGIEITQNERYTFNDGDFTQAIRKFINANSDTLKKRFDSAIKVGKVRKFDNGKIILEALSKFDFDEVQQNELLSEIRKNNPDYPQASLSIYLKNLQSTEKGAVIIVNPDNGKYSFSDPLISTYVKCVTKIVQEGIVDPKARERKVKEAMEILFAEILKV